MGEKIFSFEDLLVWQKAIKFAAKVIKITEELETGRKHFRLVEQLESCSASIAMNIAEGKGRYSKKEFIQFLYIARGSLFETITLLRLFLEKKWISFEQIEGIESEAQELSKMISSLIRTIRESI